MWYEVINDYKAPLKKLLDWFLPLFTKRYPSAILLQNYSENFHDKDFLREIKAIANISGINFQSIFLMN
jgi:hypothetical protein